LAGQWEFGACNERKIGRNTQNTCSRASWTVAATIANTLMPSPRALRYHVVWLPMWAIHR